MSKVYSETTEFPEATEVRHKLEQRKQVRLKTLHIQEFFCLFVFVFMFFDCLFFDFRHRVSL